MHPLWHGKITLRSPTEQEERFSGFRWSGGKDVCFSTPKTFMAADMT